MAHTYNRKLQTANCKQTTVAMAVAIATAAVFAGPNADLGDEALWRGDCAAAQGYYEKGIAGNDTAAMNNMAVAVLDGNFGQADAIRANGLLQKGVELGEKWCMLNLADNLRSGTGVERDAKRAQELFDRARAIAEGEFAKNASPDAALLLGTVYDIGMGVAADPRKALKYYGEVLRSYDEIPKADRLDAAIAALTLLDDALEDFNHSGDAKDMTRMMFAEAWIKALSQDRQNADAMQARSLLYLMQGKEELSGKWAKRAFKKNLECAAKGDVQAMEAAGTALAEGDGCEMDLAKAAEWFEKAIAHGSFTAKTELARILFDTPKLKDTPRAVALLREAAAMGDADAMLILAFVELRGLAGTPPDNDKALEYLQLAAECGSHDARDLLEEDNPLLSIPEAAGMEEGE